MSAFMVNMKCKLIWFSRKLQQFEKKVGRRDDDNQMLRLYFYVMMFVSINILHVQKKN